MRVFDAFSQGTTVAAIVGLLTLGSGSALAQDDLSLGETVPEGEVQIGQTYVTDTFSDWTVRCLKTESGNDPCEMFQLLQDTEATPIAEVTLFELPDGQAARAGASVVVPLETALQQQLTMRVDENPAKRYPFAFCNQIGCHARIGLTEEEVEIFRKGAAAVLSIIPMRAPDQRVSVTMSLSGFTAAYEKVAELNGT